MRIVRAPRASHFTQVPNATARDARLSRRARGLLVELLSYPDHWETDSDALAREDRGPERRDAIRGALRELEAAGYLLRARVRDEGGRWATVSAVHDTPQQPGTLPPGVDPGDVLPPADRAGKSVPAPTCDDAPGGDVAAGGTATPSPASAHPASVDQALSRKTVDEDPPPPRARHRRGQTRPQQACSRHPDGDGRNCRACGTTDRQREDAQRQARAEQERMDARARQDAAAPCGSGAHRPANWRQLVADPDGTEPARNRAPAPAGAPSSVGASR